MADLAHHHFVLPGGYNSLVDNGDKYQFLYPFGWQEVTINGADIVFKDVVEPLETVSVTIIKTDKTSISDYGSLEDVSSTLARSVLSAPGTDVQILSTTERTDEKGRKYYQLEFLAKSNFTRHQLAVVTVADGKFYTLTTGSSERRWPKIEDKLKGTVKSFEILY